MTIIMVNNMVTTIIMCIIATVVAIVFYVIKDRKMIQKYYK